MSVLMIGSSVRHFGIVFLKTIKYLFKSFLPYVVENNNQTISRYSATADTDLSVGKLSFWCLWTLEAMATTQPGQVPHRPCFTALPTHIVASWEIGVQDSTVQIPEAKKRYSQGIHPQKQNGSLFSCPTPSPFHSIETSNNNRPFYPPCW